MERRDEGTNESGLCGDGKPGEVSQDEAGPVPCKKEWIALDSGKNLVSVAF